MCCLHGATTSTTSSLRDVALAFAWRSTRIGAEEVLHTLTELLEMVPGQKAEIVRNPWSTISSIHSAPVSIMTGVAWKMRTLRKQRFQIAMTIVLVRGRPRMTSQYLFDIHPKQLHFSRGKTSNMTVNSLFLQYHHRSKSTW